MPIHQSPRTDSTRPGIDGADQARRDLLSLSLAPVRQSLTFYVEMQRALFDIVSRLTPWGTHVSVSRQRTESGPAGQRNGRATAAEAKPPTMAVDRTPKATKTAAAKPAAAKRPATKRPATTKATSSATKRPSSNTSKATTKTAKPAATKRPAASKAAATKRPAAGATPRRDTGQSGPKKKTGTASKTAGKSAARVKPAAGKKAATSPRRARAGAAKKA
jgi:hypothetical protein